MNTETNNLSNWAERFAYLVISDASTWSAPEVAAAKAILSGLGTFGDLSTLTMAARSHGKRN